MASSSFSFSSLLGGNDSTLNQTLNKLSESFSRLSTGSRLNKASSDPAGQAIASALESVIVQVGQASRNVGDALSAVSIADGAAEQVQSLNIRLQELATQSANGTLSDSDRSALQAEYSSTVQEIQRIAETTQFNGTNLLDGTSLSIQVGVDNSSNSNLNVGGLNIKEMASSLASQDISTQAGAQAALDAAQTFSDTLSSQRSSSLGAAQARLDSIDSSLSAKRQADQEALSRIEDADYAEEIAQATALMIRAQTGTALQAQTYNLNVNVIKTLLS
jgi:flagellin